MSAEFSTDPLAQFRALVDEWREGGDSPLSGLDARQRLALVEALLGENLCRQLGIYRLPDDFLLSVVVPVYNEAATIDELIRRVRTSGVPCEIIIVDDGSTDGTRERLERYRQDSDITLLLHKKNQGKGAALTSGFARARGEIVIIQDADLEYDPRDYVRLIQPIVAGEADVVFGSRFRADNQRPGYFWSYVGNRLITLLSNLRTNRRLTDVETCYKVFRRETLAKIASTLRERGFGIELELTAKITRLPGVRLMERPISYAGRTYAEGKKISLRDGLRALWCIVRY